MKLNEEFVSVPSSAGPIRTKIITPVGAGPFPAVLLYTDIFQITESTLRTSRALASYGFIMAVPEIYPHGELAGVALDFDDAGKARGLAGAASMTTSEFDADRVAVLDHLAGFAGVSELFAAGFCIGGHLAFRAAFDPRVSATVCFYPTGLQNGGLGGDVADSLSRAAEIGGRLLIIFGTADPHVPADARAQIVTAVYSAGLTDTEFHVYSGGEHAFMRDIGPRHDPALSERAMTEAVAFLRNL